MQTKMAFTEHWQPGGRDCGAFAVRKARVHRISLPRSRNPHHRLKATYLCNGAHRATPKVYDKPRSAPPFLGILWPDKSSLDTEKPISSGSISGPDSVGFLIGQRVHFVGDTHRIGTVKYVGAVEGYGGNWVGVDWDNGDGKHDGSHNGVRYFEAQGPKSASFVRPHNLSSGFPLLKALELRLGSIFPIKEVQQIEDLASILKCKIEKLPTVYLGLRPNLTIEKTEKKLAIWKSQYLSLGGRVTLINSVLDSLPTYVMSLFPIPSRIVKVLDALRGNFLWQGNKIEKGFNLVKWSVVQQSKKNGGLGMRNLKVHNRSLLSKWLWRYNQEEQALWKEIINHKSGHEDFWCTSEVNETYGVGVWRTIKNLWESLKNNSQIVVGRGDKTKFWLDDWCGNGILRDLFPIFFSQYAQIPTTRWRRCGHHMVGI
ncbi:hypothetical protein MTR67_048524 [Solanum verrucosum]|uniref:CAP-Gly domain-containing protein n=1 Tax=Solanum verrucosum TaxID=315347 RepID=A0AAF0V0Z2_SOLVR|nr:hypothetical protein MTR67_048524 [Solanum verrucosum]